MQLLLESKGIFGFDECGTIFSNCPYTIENDDILVRKMHDRVAMQLITTTLSAIAMSCAIGNNSSRDQWIRLKE